MQLVIGAGWNSLHRQGLVWGLGIGLGISLAVGCSRTPPATGAKSAAEVETDTDGAESTSQRHVKGAAAGRNQAVSTASKRKMIGDIPLDVWFENPIGESKQTGTAATATTPDPKPVDAPPKTAPPTETPAAPAKSTGRDWGSVISLDDLQEETKKIRLNLQDYLSALGKYNAHNKDIAMEGSVLGALAAIALVHPEKVSWKQYAAQIRDIAAEMAKKSKGLGPKPFDEVKKEFEKIDGLLSGNPPPGVPEAGADVPFSEAVSRRGLMKRLETGAEFLRANFQTEATLSKGQEEAAHAATVVAALSKVIGTEGYPSADEPEYQGFANGLMEANLNMAKAARDKDFAAFSETNGKVIKFCNECHGAYQSASN